MRFPSPLLVAPLLGAVCAAAPPARADEPPLDKKDEARGRFARGVELYRDGDYRGALIEFDRAYQILPHFRVQYNIGQTCLELQDYACALRAFQKYVADGNTDAPADRRASAEGEVKRLQKLVAYLRVVVDQPGAEVLIDNVEIGRAPLAEPVLVSAGRRTVTVILPPHAPATRAVDVAGGDHVDLTIQLGEARREALPATKPAVSVAWPPPRRSTAPVWIGVGITAALGVGTAVVGIVTLSAKKDFDRARDTYPASSASIDDARSKVTRDALITDVLGAATIVGAAVTAYLAFSARGANDVRVGLAPGGASLSGRF
jgi:tetratricopeptide (TPR) repeat protein